MAELVLYDGVCGLCQGLVRFVLKRDRANCFEFASLQSPLAAQLLRRHGRSAQDLDTMFVLADHGTAHERLLERAEAALFVLGRLGGPWSLARGLALLPPAWLDRAYRFVAARRNRWFGRSGACLVPSPEQRVKFLDGLPPS